MKKFIVFEILLLLLTPLANAQWSSEVKLGGLFYTGNVDKFNLNSSGNISHADSAFEFSANYKINYSEVDDSVNNQLIEGVLKYDYNPYGILSPFTLVKAYNNEPRGIKMRLSGLVGLKYTFINTVDKNNNEINDYSISAAIEYDREKYTTEKSDTSKLRWSIRPKFEQNIGENVSFRHVTFYIPKVDNFSDYIIESTTSVNTKISDNFSLELRYELEHFSHVIRENMENTDQSVRVSLVFSI